MAQNPWGTMGQPQSWIPNGQYNQRLDPENPQANEDWLKARAAAGFDDGSGLQTVDLNGQKYYRTGYAPQDLGGNPGLASQALYDPTYGWLSPQDSWGQAFSVGKYARDPSTFDLLKPSLGLAGLATGFNVLSGLGGLGGAAGGAGGATGAVPGVVEGALASEAGFVPGSFELGTTAAGGTAASGLGGGAAAGGGLFSGGLGALNSALGTNLTGTDAARIAAGLGQGALGYLGAGQQADAYRDVANQQAAIGAPYRDRLSASYQPGFDLAAADPAYANALKVSGNEAARAVSAQSGNPYGNPGAMAEIQDYIANKTALPYTANYRGQLGQFGGLGLNTSGQASLMGAQTSGGGLDAIGYGLGTAFGGNSSMDDYFKKLLAGQGTSNFTNVYR